MKMNVRQFLKLFVALVAVPFVLAACSKDNEPEPTPVPEPTPTPTPAPEPEPEPDYSVAADQQGLFIFNSGNQGKSIDGSLSFINFSKQEVANGVFAAKNERSLGGTVQNGAVFKDKLYIAVYGSKTIEVVDKLTLASVKQITIPSDKFDDGPRYVVADDNFVYASLYSGEVIRINPSTNEIDKWAQVGPNPEEMVILNGYLFVVNSDGLNWEGGYANGKSVSKINLTTFAEEKKIAVGMNPTRIATDGISIFVLSMGDYGMTPSSIYVIDPEDRVADTSISATWFTVYKGMLYVINSVYNADWSTTNFYYSYKLTDMSLVSEAFLGNDEVDAPANILIDAEGGHIYVSSYNVDYGYPVYDTDGYVAQYDMDGKFQKKYDVGVGPCFMTVLR